MNENENNKNREYPQIDKRIKDTYIKHSTAQKTKTYDMYSRFYRWAMDRLDENGIIAFITNRSFIDSRTFDGFRKTVLNEFDFAYIIDTKSDVRQNPRIAGTTHNVFGIQAGVAVMFLIKKKQRENANCRISYFTMEDNWRKEDKLLWLAQNKLDSIDFTSIEPDKDHNWLNLVENDWGEMIPLGDKRSRSRSNQRAVFYITSLGLNTARDDWVYDFSKDSLEEKVNYLVRIYNDDLTRLKDTTDKELLKQQINYEIKWTRSVISVLAKRIPLEYNELHIKDSSYRPFINKVVYHSSHLNEMPSYTRELFSTPNVVIAINISSGLFYALATNKVPDYHYCGDTGLFGLKWHDKDDYTRDNITDWSLDLFRSHYQDQSIGKEDIFRYVYGVLHDPAYRKKYEINLKRSLPRVPFQADFWQWATWGNELMNLHLNFENVEPWPLELSDTPLEAGITPKPKLKADKANGSIQLDDHSSLHGVPDSAWDYKLGNRSALEWILDQYKEKKPKDPTIAKLFNSYRFADYKDKVIDLLRRVCTVSLKTVEIVSLMEKSSPDFK